MIATKGKFPGGRWSWHRNDAQADVRRQDEGQLSQAGRQVHVRQALVGLHHAATRPATTRRTTSACRSNVPREIAETWALDVPGRRLRDPRRRARGGQRRRDRQLHELRAVRGDHGQGRAADDARGRRRAALPAMHRENRSQRDRGAACRRVRLRTTPRQCAATLFRRPCAAPSSSSPASPPWPAARPRLRARRPPPLTRDARRRARAGPTPAQRFARRSPASMPALAAHGADGDALRPLPARVGDARASARGRRRRGFGRWAALDARRRRLRLHASASSGLQAPADVPRRRALPLAATRAGASSARARGATPRLPPARPAAGPARRSGSPRSRARRSGTATLLARSSSTPGATAAGAVRRRAERRARRPAPRRRRRRCGPRRAAAPSTFAGPRCAPGTVAAPSTRRQRRGRVDEAAETRQRAPGRVPRWRRPERR